MSEIAKRVIDMFENIILNHQNAGNDAQLEQHKLQLEKLNGLQDTVYEFISMLERQYAYPDVNIPSFSELCNRIFSTVTSYGSTDSVKIVTEIKKRVYLASNNSVDLPASDLIALFVLLAAQVKYDVTNVKTSPDTWYITNNYKSVELNFNNFYTDSAEFINKTIKELHLKNIPKIRNVILE